MQEHDGKKGGRTSTKDIFVLPWGWVLGNVSGASHSNIMLSLGVLSELGKLQLCIQCMTFASSFDQSSSS